MRILVEKFPGRFGWIDAPDGPGQRKPCATCGKGRQLKPAWEIVPGLRDPIPEQAPHLARGDPRDRARHLAALRWLLRQDVPPPAVAQGDGIVIAGGGKYWPMTVVAVGMARDATALPIQVWHGAGQDVFPEQLAHLPGVTYHNAALLPHRRMGAWEIKTQALLHCGFARALYLDADAYPVADPAPLFELASEYSFVYWENLPEYGARDCWDVWGLDAAEGGKVPAVQGGHMVFDLRRWRRELVLSHWMCQHSEYSYQFGNGDEGCYRAVLAATDGPYRCLGPAEWRGKAFVCAWEGWEWVVHRCQAKAWIETDPRLPGEAQAMSHLAAWLCADPAARQPSPPPSSLPNRP